MTRTQWEDLWEPLERKFQKETEKSWDEDERWGRRERTRETRKDGAAGDACTLPTEFSKGDHLECVKREMITNDTTIPNERVLLNVIKR